MAKWKPGLHKDAAAIFEGVSIPSTAVTATRSDRKEDNSNEQPDTNSETGKTAISMVTPTRYCSYFRYLKSKELYSQLHIEK